MLESGIFFYIWQLMLGPYLSSNYLPERRAERSVRAASPSICRIFFPKV
jgi:hypothetical protein